MLNIPQRPPIANVTDESNIALIQSWLTACDGEGVHSNCLLRDAPVLPTRVLDVTGVNTTGEVRLVLSNASMANYAALSYCWPRQNAGDAKPFVTTTSNVDSMLSGVKVSQLSGPQRTCLMLAEKLGIQYVWIDGLCIIQGQAIAHTGIPNHTDLSC